MGITLFVWITVYGHLALTTGHWEKLEVYSTPMYCHNAAQSLGIEKGIYRCVNSMGDQV